VKTAWVIRDKESGEFISFYSQREMSVIFGSDAPKVFISKPQATYFINCRIKNRVCIDGRNGREVNFNNLEVVEITWEVK